MRFKVKQMKLKTSVMILLLVTVLTNNSFAQTINTKILMDIVVVQMPTANFTLLQKQQFLWQNNPQYLITLIENMYQQDKTAISIVRSQTIADDNEAIVIVGNAEATNKDKRSLDAAHTLKVTPKLWTNDQLSLLVQDQKNANNKATAGGVAFEKTVSEQLLVTNKALTLVAVARLPKARQLIFITPTIKHEKN